MKRIRKIEPVVLFHQRSSHVSQQCDQINERNKYFTHSKMKIIAKAAEFAIHPGGF